MANCMSQSERIAFRAIDGGGFLVMLPRNIAAMQVSLNLAQARERLPQLNRDVRVPAEVDSLHQIPLGFTKAILSSRLKSLAEEFVDCVRHDRTYGTLPGYFPVRRCRSV